MDLEVLSEINSIKYNIKAIKTEMGEIDKRFDKYLKFMKQLTLKIAELEHNQK